MRVGCADAVAVRAAYDEMLAEVARRRPAARLDGVVVQPIVAGGVEVVLGVKPTRYSGRPWSSAWAASWSKY